MAFTSSNMFRDREKVHEESIQDRTGMIKVCRCICGADSVNIGRLYEFRDSKYELYSCGCGTVMTSEYVEHNEVGKTVRFVNPEDVKLHESLISSNTRSLNEE